MPRNMINFEGDLCVDCGVRPKALHEYAEDGTPRYKKRCTSCHSARYRTPWSRHRKDYCEACNYKPFWARALSVHHRDGNNKNNELTNLMTLCHNCHQELEGFIHSADGEWTKGENLFKKFIRVLISK